MGDQIGPFYSTGRVRELLGGISEQALRARRRRGTLLGMRTSDGVWVYPTFQFRDERVRRDLVPVLRVFAGMDSWTVAFWLTTEVEALDFRRPEEWLRNGGDPARVLASARENAARWA